MQVLVVDPPNGHIPERTREMARAEGWGVRITNSYRDAITRTQTEQFDAALLPSPSVDTRSTQDAADFAGLLARCEERRIAAIVLGERKSRRDYGTLVDVVAPDISEEELRGRFAMIDRFRGHLQHLEQELSRVERLSRDLTSRFEEVDQELQLASRLQRDFLPNLSKPFHNVRFSSVFHPASWVSGDIFDVFAINERSTGFYMVDAVGHGMAASLLTMFIRRVVSYSTGSDSQEDLLDPSRVLERINDALTSQDLPQCQFVTACYGVIDHAKRRIRLARGGHPYPLLVDADGQVQELSSKGGLLGIFSHGQYETVEHQLQKGDRLVLYTDGAESAFCRRGMKTDPVVELREALQAVSRYPLEGMLERFESIVNERAKDAPVQDDVSILGLEVCE